MNLIDSGSNDVISVNNYIDDMKVLVGYIDYFKVMPETDTLEDPYNESMLGFINVIKDLTNFHFDYNQVLADLEIKDTFDAALVLEDLDIMYAKAILLKLVYSDRTVNDAWKDAVKDGIILRILERFSNEIEYIENNKKFYVYALVDPTNNHRPFYIGKGRNKRVFDHFSMQLNDEVTFNDSSIEDAKRNKIEQLKKQGYMEEEIYRILAKNLSESEAFCLEAFLIQTVYGIDNLTNKVMGQHHERFRKYDTLDALSLFDMYLTKKPSLWNSRDHISKEMIDRGLDEPLLAIAEKLSHYHFSTPKVLDAGELGIEAEIENMITLKIYIRSKCIYLELRPRRKTQREQIKRHFVKLGIESYLRNDLVYNPTVWLKCKTDDIDEVVRRAEILIKLLKIKSRDELDAFGELFVEIKRIQPRQLKDVERLTWICNPENLHMYKNESEYIKITDTLATKIAGWNSPGQYSMYIELSSAAIENNISNSNTIDMNACIATLICVHREQHFSNSEVISERIKSGDLLKIMDRIKNLLSQLVMLKEV